jgi:arylsulfatase A-like enzyme
LYHNDKPYRKSTESLTYRQGSEVISIIEKSVTQREPFYIHFWFDAPHKPLESIDPNNRKYKNPNNLNDREKYATMVESVDTNVGRVLNTLDRLGIENNTVVIFLSDNGPENGAGSAGSFKGRKRSMYEGGIRIPCLWQWKNHFLPRYDDAFAMSTDILPTFMDIAGISRPTNMRSDGLSIYRFLMGATDRPTLTRRPVWHTVGGTIFDETTYMKVVSKDAKRDKESTNQAFNLTTDKYEKNDIFHKHNIELGKELAHELKVFIEDGAKEHKRFKAIETYTCEYSQKPENMKNLKWRSDDASILRPAYI